MDLAVLDVKMPRGIDAKSVKGVVFDNCCDEHGSIVGWACQPNSETLHSPLTTHHSLKKSAFTLPEVLITLGIIGVVAAITIPSIVNKYRRVEIESGLEKAYNTLQNAIALSEIENGAISTWNEKNLNATEFWKTYLKPYFKNAKLCSSLQTCSGYSGVFDPYKWHKQGQWNVVTAGDRLVFQLQDGIVVFWLKDLESLGQTHTVIFIDANGSRGPNIGGYDVFVFVKDYNKNKIIAEKGNCKANTRFCAYEIMSNGWKFPRNYPYL